MIHVKNILQRFWTFFYKREWAGMLGFVTFALSNAESIAELVSGEIEKAGETFDPKTLLILFATILIRYNVWSRAKVEKDVEASLRIGRHIGRAEASPIDPNPPAGHDPF